MEQETRRRTCKVLQQPKKIDVWKHHISKHFEEDPSLLKNNGAGKGGTVFYDLNKLIKYLIEDGRKWHIAQLQVYEDQIVDNEDGETATMKEYVQSITGFQPLEKYLKQ